MGLMGRVGCQRTPDLTHPDTGQNTAASIVCILV